MSVDLDYRRAFIKLINQMNDDDVQRMLIHASGYEAGKVVCAVNRNLSTFTLPFLYAEFPTTDRSV